MGLFNSIFSNSNNQSLQEAINWINLTNLDEITDIKTLSISESIFIFKHSTRCGISRMVKKQFEKFWKYIDSKKEEYKSLFVNGQGEREVKIRNFTKKLLGRIVFLHFLQKKGFME